MTVQVDEVRRLQALRKEADDLQDRLRESLSRVFGVSGEPDWALRTFFNPYASDGAIAKIEFLNRYRHPAGEIPAGVLEAAAKLRRALDRWEAGAEPYPEWDWEFPAPAPTTDGAYPDWWQR